jgi:hypothetical protein
VYVYRILADKKISSDKWPLEEGIIDCNFKKKRIIDCGMEI